MNTGEAKPPIARTERQASGWLAAWAKSIEHGWWSPGLSAPERLLLSLLAGLYGAVLRVRRLGFRQGWLKTRHLKRPTLVIGNRIVGGAGKTPCTLALVQALQERGWHPGIVSRGYGRTTEGVMAVQSASSGAQEVGDEPLLMARRSGVPVWVGRDRHAAGCALLEAHPEVDLILCDDGLQHLQLGRDAEVIVFDERGIGNGALLPRGPMREPLDVPSTAQYQWSIDNLADTHGATPLPTRVGEAVPTWRASHWRARRQLTGALPLQAWWRGADASDWLDWHAVSAEIGDARALAIAGIAEPERFFRALAAQGLAVQTQPCTDHADHAVLPFDAGVAHVLVTEKDAVKLDPRRLARERPDTRVWVIPMTLDLPTPLVDAIDRALRQIEPKRQAHATPR